MKKALPLLRPAFLLLFIILLRAQMLQVWLILYLVSLVFPALYGRRIYCMVACPIHPLMLVSVWLKGKLARKDKPAPAWLSSGWASWAALAVTVALFIVSRKALGRDLPAMLFWMAAGFLMTLTFHPDVFHDLLCPYGVMQRILAKLSYLSPEGRAKARNYQGFTKSVLGGGRKQGEKPKTK